MKRIYLMAAVAVFCAWGKAAKGAGDEVIVLYNKNLPESKGVADYYAEKRSVPKSQLFGFSLTTNEEISRVEFREHLQKPLAKMVTLRPGNRLSITPVTEAEWNHIQKLL